MTYTAYENPGTTIKIEQVSSWEASGTYTTAARVTEPNLLYSVRTTLQGGPVYFITASSIIDGEFQFRYDATDDGSVTMTAEQTLVLRSVGEDGEETIEYWRTTSTIGQQRVREISPRDHDNII